MAFLENLNFSKICWSRVALKSGNGGAKETLLNTLLLLHSWAKSQKPAKNKINIFVKLTDHTCALGCPRLWRITKNSLHNEGIYK